MLVVVAQEGQGIDLGDGDAGLLGGGGIEAQGERLLKRVGCGPGKGRCTVGKDR
jgi:hypothetical protein